MSKLLKLLKPEQKALFVDILNSVLGIQANLSIRTDGGPYKKGSAHWWAWKRSKPGWIQFGIVDTTYYVELTDHDGTFYKLWVPNGGVLDWRKILPPEHPGYYNRVNQDPWKYPYADVPFIKSEDDIINILYTYYPDRTSKVTYYYRNDNKTVILYNSEQQEDFRYDIMSARGRIPGEPGFGDPIDGKNPFLPIPEVPLPPPIPPPPPGPDVGPGGDPALPPPRPPQPPPPTTTPTPTPGLPPPGPGDTNPNPPQQGGSNPFNAALQEVLDGLTTQNIVKLLGILGVGIAGGFGLEGLDDEEVQPYDPMEDPNAAVCALPTTSILDHPTGQGAFRPIQYGQEKPKKPFFADERDIPPEVQPGPPGPTLRPVPPGWFRTAAGLCRKWNDDERAVINAAQKKRRKMYEQQAAKLGCHKPKKVCYFVNPNGSKRRCNCK